MTTIVGNREINGITFKSSIDTLTTLSSKEFKAKVLQPAEDDRLKLYWVILGGHVEGFNIELHNVVFTVGTSLGSKVQSLINSWKGKKEGLHIDGFVEVRSVDGYKVTINKLLSDSIRESKDEEKLFYLNYGGYGPKFGEVHEDGLVVAKDLFEAKKKAMLCQNLKSNHLDDHINFGDPSSITFDVDDIMEVTPDEYEIILTPTDEKLENHAFQGFGPISIAK